MGGARRRWVAVIVAVVVGAVVAGGLAAARRASADDSSTLRVLGGSELSDLAPILKSAQDATGVKVVLQYTGSLDGAEQIAHGAGVDAAWFASDKYITLAGASNKVLSYKNTMLSPVVVGVKKSVADQLGWTNGSSVSWLDIADAAGSGRFRYAMTNPTASNSGFSALVGVADAFAGGEALSPSTIDADGLKKFLSGQALTAGSSGFLADAYAKSQGQLDGIINYESVLLGLNASKQLHDKLVLVYPKEGIVTAEYPLMLLKNSKRQQFDKVTKYLTSKPVQARIQRVTGRRAVTPGVAPDPRFPTGVLVEAPFPANLDVVQLLLDQYQTTLRKPANTVYVLDLSGSMQGSRLSRLKRALLGLAGADSSFTGHFSQFAPREKVTLVPFAGHVLDTHTFDIDSTDPQSVPLRSLQEYVGSMSAGGNTAIYSALARADQVASQLRAANPDSYTSVVLLTDGENNAGIDPSSYLAQVRGQDPGNVVRTYTVLFGEANPRALQDVADATGGKVFDARNADLSSVFKEIRGYQ
jgi:Ca-activated chloride channel family protein